MKNFYRFGLLLLTVLPLTSCIVSHSPKMTYFDNPYYDYRGTEFTSVSVPMFLTRPFLKKALREDGESEELLSLLSKISDVRVLTVKNGNSAMLADFTKHLAKKNFEDWMTIKKDQDVINFQVRQKGEVMRKVLITVRTGTELVVVDVDGKFTADDISKLINYSEKKDLKKIVSK